MSCGSCWAVQLASQVATAAALASRCTELRQAGANVTTSNHQCCQCRRSLLPPAAVTRCCRYDEIEGDYSELLASSIFCMVVPGHGWSARMEDATLHGCIPVIIMVCACWLAACLLMCWHSCLAAGLQCAEPAVPAMPAAQDDVKVSFDSVVDLSAFTIRIAQADVEKLPQILLAVSEERREEMRRSMARVWQRCVCMHACGPAAAPGQASARCWSFARPPRRLSCNPGCSFPCRFTYSSYRPYAKRIRELQQRNAAEGREAANSSQPQPLSWPATVPDLDTAADDAFGTIMGWLYHRIKATR